MSKGERAERFVRCLKEKGFNFFTGVPCTILKDIILILESDPDTIYIPSVREDAAIGLAAGAYLSGKSPVVLMQNSGLGYSLNAITSLNLIYKIPTLIIVSWRGFQGKDAPEHLVMGKISLRLLEIIGLPYIILTPNKIEEAIEEAGREMENKMIPVAILVKKGVIV
jgi:sulfopyruvate decarboxylase alpha subunit